MWSDPALKEICRDYFRQAERPETRIAKYDETFKDNPEVEFGTFNEDWEFPA